MQRRLWTRARLRALVAGLTVGGLLLPSVALAQESPEDPPPPSGEDFTTEDYAAWLSTDPDDDEIEDIETGPFAGLLDHLGSLVRLAAPDDAARALFTSDVSTRVTILTTGVDLVALGEGASAVTLSSLGAADGSDAVGWGTWATSVLLQAAPSVAIDVVDVYPELLPDESALAAALAAVDVDVTDAVLLAFPPGDIVDPMTRILGSGRANDFFDAALDTIVTREDGSKVVGIPLDDQARGTAEYIGGWADKRDVRSAGSMIQRWETLVDAVAALAADGVPVIAPAGDVGPVPQSVFGLAGLADVITVGATDAAGAVVATSARGPSVHGTAKPDVVAPVVFAGVLPETSALTDLLGSVDLIDSALDIVLGGDVSAARTASASTLSAAASLTAAIGGLHAAGVDDLATMRGALIAAAEPSADRDVLAEGAGVVSALPTIDLLDRPLVSGALDLGMEPDDASADWSAAVDILGGSPDLAEVVLDRWVGTGMDGRRDEGVVGPADRPVVSSSIVSATSAGESGLVVQDGRLGVFLAPGDNAWEPGVFCGYSRVTLIGTSSDVDTEATIGTGPVEVPEDVPTCLVEGMRLDVLNFYIHDVPAQDFTMALLPNLPVGMDVVEGPTMVLPVHPTKERLYSKVSGEDGYTTFGAVVPGFYRMRQFSDYSIDVEEQHPAGVINRDLGNPLTYSQKDSLILPDLVCQVPREERGPAPDPCHVDLLDDLDAAFGDGDIGYDKTTGRYFVDLPGLAYDVDQEQFVKASPGPMPTPVVLGWAKKMQLTVISSRYVDVLGGADWTTDSPNRTAQEVVNLLSDLTQVEELDEVGRPLAAAVDQLVEDLSDDVAAIAGLTDAWQWSAAPAPGDPLTGNYAGLSTTSDPTTVIGMADYPFSLTTPNYKGSVDWNFTYELDEVALIAIVEVGKERHVALFTPAGVVSLSPITTEQPVDPIGMLEVSTANGVAHLKYLTHPRGAPAGLLTLLALPLEPMDPATMTLADMSMEVTTWQRIEWPPTTHERNGATITGHEFEVQPRWNARQMQDRCRAVDVAWTGGYAGRVCEEWNLIVHSGRYDVETFQMVDPVSGQDVTAEMRPAGALFHDPMRGVTDATLTLAHRATLSPVVDVDQGIRRELRSNGEFFEMLHVPNDVVAAHPDRLVFRQADNVIGRLATTITDHRVGGVPLSGYLRFVAQHVDGERLGLPALPGGLLGTAQAFARRQGPIIASAPRRATTTTDEVEPPAPISSVEPLEGVLLDAVAQARLDAGSDPSVPAWDLFVHARDWAAEMAATGSTHADPQMADNVCCAAEVGMTILASDLLAGDVDGQVTVRHLREQLLASPALASLVSDDLDHVGIGVVIGGDGRMYAAMSRRTWDGAATPIEPEPDPTPDPTPAPVPGGGGGAGGGGGGGGGGGAAGGGVTAGPPPPSSVEDAGEVTAPPTETSGSTAGADPTFVVPPAPANQLNFACDLTTLHGDSREATATAISSATFATSDVVVIAQSSQFADALTGAPLAALLGAPLLLNPTDVGRAGDGRGLVPEVVVELERLQPSAVILLGGERALGRDVADEIQLRTGVAPFRIAGTDRHRTATAVANHVVGRSNATHAYLVEGSAAWPDAVSSAAVAAWRGSPILLTHRDRLDLSTAAWLLQSDITSVTIVGGAGVVSTTVAAELTALGITVDRLGGQDRYATSAKVASHAVGLGMSDTGVWIATGRNYPDALSAGPAAARLQMPLLLVDGTDVAGGTAAMAWVDARRAGLTNVIVVGGPRAMRPEVVARLGC